MRHGCGRPSRSPGHTTGNGTRSRLPWESPDKLPANGLPTRRTPDPSVPAGLRTTPALNGFCGDGERPSRGRILDVHDLGTVMLTQLSCLG